MLPLTRLNALSAQEYRQVIDEAQLSTNSAQVQAVQRVGQRIAEAADQAIVRCRELLGD